MRLIDADALRESIITRQTEMSYEDAWALTCVDNAPTIEPQKWVSCSERLPDIKEHHVSEPCIVYCENGAYGFTELEENIFGQVGWHCEREDEFHESLGKVLAWMPLPEPWKGEE